MQANWGLATRAGRLRFRRDKTPSKPQPMQHALPTRSTSQAVATLAAWPSNGTVARDATSRVSRLPKSEPVNWHASSRPLNEFRSTAGHGDQARPFRASSFAVDLPIADVETRTAWLAAAEVALRCVDWFAACGLRPPCATFGSATNCCVWESLRHAPCSPFRPAGTTSSVLRIWRLNGSKAGCRSMPSRGLRPRGRPPTAVHKRVMQLGV